MVDRYKIKQPDGTRYSYSSFMLLCGYSFSALVAWIGINTKQLLFVVVWITKDKSSLPATTGAKLGVFYSAATGCSLTAMKYISIPAQILAKTIKILPGTLLLRNQNSCSLQPFWWET